MSQLLEHDLNSISGNIAHPGRMYPDDIVAAPDLTTAEKRAILASWASDERAVIGDPARRQLPSGAVVRLREITRALETLDRPSQPQRDDWRHAWWPSNRRRRPSRGFARRRRPSHDDDDPPLPPVLAAMRPKAAA